jgi:hypothetical protein
MTRSPVLTSSWDHRRRGTTYKVAIEGTGKFLLFTDDTLRQLQAQINEALKGAHDVQHGSLA